MDVGSGEEGEGGMNGQSMETYTLPYVKEIANGNLLYDSRNSNQGSVTPCWLLLLLSHFSRVRLCATP